VVRDLPFGRETLKSGGGQPVTPSVKKTGDEGKIMRFYGGFFRTRHNVKKKVFLW
jgi:hypothetical protein